MLCLKYSETTEPTERQASGANSVTHYRGALPWDIPSRQFRALLPLRPLFPNLLLNTLFYATLFSIPYLLRQARRHLRLRRGHCPFCNYDLRGQPNLCPECGHAPTPA